MTTEVNGTVSYNVLDDYFSPTGDDLYPAVRDRHDSADEVSFRPDGTITYRNTGGGRRHRPPVSSSSSPTASSRPPAR